LRIDRTHGQWAGWTAATGLLACGAYFYFSRKASGAHFGGTPAGLAFGIAGYLCMLFAVLLSVRKKFTTWRIGKAQTWMRGHLWLGLLSYPLIWLHADWSWGSGLALCLMLLLSAVVLTGVAGAVIQHYLPHIMTDTLASETIYYESASVQKQLVKEAETLVEPLFRKGTQYGLLVPASERTAAREGVTTLVRFAGQSGQKLQAAYTDTIKPYLDEPKAYHHKLGDKRTAEVLFAELRMVVPKEAYALIDDLEGICRDKRDLDRQSRFHNFMYLWLLVHVPLSFLLIGLGLLHAVIAWHYL